MIMKLAGKDDKRQITAGLFGGSLMGDFALTVIKEDNLLLASSELRIP